MNATILIAEDDAASGRLLHRYLTLKGYQVVWANDGSKALNDFLMHSPDVVLLDVNMPKLDGWSVLEEIRSLSDVPVIMVTVNDSTDDKVKGLTAGADDYVTKPFDLKEIDARVQAVLRRSRPKSDGKRIQIGSMVIDDDSKEVKINDEIVNLSPKEYELLLFLAERRGKVTSSLEILEHIWPERADEATGEDVKKYIYLLRSKLGSKSEGQPVIETVRGFGYKLVEPQA